MNIGKGVIVHGLFEVYGVQDLQLVTVFQKCVPTLDHDTTFGLPFVKIKNQDAAVNSKVSSFRFFLDDFSHLSV